MELKDARCEEMVAAFGMSVQCRNEATTVVYHDKDRHAYCMCTACADHNLHNRGAELIASNDSYIAKKYKR